jgi:hypothetical protein
LIDTFRREYPRMWAQSERALSGDFEAEIQAEAVQAEQAGEAVRQP